MFSRNQLLAFRKEFPITEKLIYVNHAAVSPVSLRVKNAINQYLDGSAYENPENLNLWLEMRNELRKNISQLIHAPESQIAFVKNTAIGLNLLTNGLSWKTGDRILLANCEFPSNVYPFLLQKKHGVEIDFIETKDGFLHVEDFENKITPRTRLISISFVEYLNGYCNDLETLGKLCKSRGIIFSVDSIQGVGAVPLDVEKCQIDFLSNGGHKWLLSQAGLGFVYIRPELFEQLAMDQIGWLSVKNPWDTLNYRLDYLESPQRYESSSENFLGIYAMKSMVEWLLEIGITNIFNHLRSLNDIIIRQLDCLNMVSISSVEEKHRSGFFSFHAKDPVKMPAQKIFDYLVANGIISSLRNNAIRISPHFYNTPEEMNRIADLLKRL